ASSRPTPPPSPRRPGAALGNPRHIGGPRERPVATILRDLLETRRVVPDELVIEPAPLDHDLEHAGKERRVTARFHWQIEIACPRDGRNPRVLDDDLGALLARLPDVICRNR